MFTRRLLWLLLILPAISRAGTNPFASSTKPSKNTEPHNVFYRLATSGKTLYLKSEINKSLELPPPIPALRTIARLARVNADKRSSVRRKPKGTTSPVQHCSWGLMPVVPEQDREAGIVNLKFDRGTVNCIKGIESSETWLKIGFFNGRTLQIHLEKNAMTIPRTGTLVFASINSSRELEITQRGYAAGEKIK